MNQAIKFFPLSVITVSAFDPNRLKVTLTSILEVADLNFEHITVLPKDDEPSITIWNNLCSKFPNFKLTYDEGFGVYPAMNIGSLVASGKYLVFWNSGEEVTNRAQFKLLLELLNKSSSPQVVSQGKIEWLPLHEQNLEEYQGFISGYLNRFISHQTYFVGSQLFRDRGGFSKKYSVAADTAFILNNASLPIEFLAKCCPVFVQASKFASAHQRIGRFETLRINAAYGFRTGKFRRLFEFGKLELSSLQKMLSELFELNISDKAAGEETIKVVEHISYKQNFGRDHVLKQFVYHLTGLAPDNQDLQINVAGGSFDDPEVKYLLTEFPGSKVTTFGIENADVFLDLNTPIKSKIIPGDIVLVSQVLEHVWNHQAFFQNTLGLSKLGGVVWIGCPASNKFHGSPDYFSAGFTSSYLKQNFNQLGAQTLAEGFFGTKRLYLATHWLPGWFSVRGHKFPLLFAFENRRLVVKIVLRVRFFFHLMTLSLISGSMTSNPRWATETWILLRNSRGKNAVD